MLDFKFNRFILNDFKIQVVSSKLEPMGVSFAKWDLMNVLDSLKKRGEVSGIDTTEEAYIEAEKILKHFEEINLIKHSVEEIPLQNKWIKTIPFIDQWGAIRLLLTRQFAGNWDTMGAGKTFVSIYAYAVLKEYGLAKNVLVLCINSAKETWYEEVHKHSDFRITTCGNGTMEVLNRLNGFSREDFLIVHYDALLNPKVVDRLLKMKFDVIIIDEAHKIKNLKAKRTIEVLRLVNMIERYTLLDTEITQKLGMEIINNQKPVCWCMTGTPVSERPSNAYTLLKVLYEKDFAISHNRFEGFFCIFQELTLRNKRKIKKIIGFRNCDQLARILEPVSIGRKQEELKGLPKGFIIDKKIQMEEKQRGVYKKIREGVIDELKKLGKAKIKIGQLNNIFIRLHEVLNHPGIIGLEDIPSVKHDTILEMIEEIETEPILVWANYRKGMEILKNRLRQRDIEVELIYGGTDENDIRRICKYLEKGKVKVLIASIKKLGTSVDFLKVFRKAIYLDIPFSFTEFVQSKDRLIRRGISSNAIFFRLVVEQSLDEYICELLNRKEKMVNEVSVDRDIEIEIEEVIRQI